MKEDMTQEDRIILIRELCARLPHKMKVINAYGEVGPLSMVDLAKIYKPPIPYLRPMSSMTEEEQEEAKENGVICYNEFEGGSTLFDENGFDWLNAHHFDYRGLIERGMALEATNETYKI